MGGGLSKGNAASVAILSSSAPGGPARGKGIADREGASQNPIRWALFENPPGS